MSDVVILYRTNDGPVRIVIDEDGEVSMFTDARHAQRYADDNELFQSGQALYQIVELDDL